MAGAAGSGVREEELRERLRLVCGQLSQAEVARRTGSSQNNVSRYLRGTRIPLDFGSALVEGAGVNPSWLLAGQGKPWLADVSSETARTSSGLMELVQSMSAIAKMRLGSLTGKRHAQALRELNDSLRVYEKTREQLADRTRDLFGDILGDYDAAVKSRRMPRARELQRAAEQVARLCPDRDLAHRFKIIQAFHQRANDDAEAAAELQREAFHGFLLSEAIAKPELCLEAQNLAGALWNLGFAAEARAVCRASLALAEHEGSEWPEFYVLAATCGFIEADLGLLLRGKRRLEECFPKLPPNRRDAIGYAFLLRVQLLAGVTDVRAALEFGPPMRNRGTSILRFAAWQEEREPLRLAVARLIGEADGQIPRDDPGVRQHLALLEALTKPRAAILQRFRKFVGEHGSARALGRRIEFSLAVTTSQIARILGKRKEALAALDEAERIRLQMQPRGVPSVCSLGIHFRSALRLLPAKGAGQGTPRRSLRAAADEFFTELPGKGYACFAKPV